MKKDYKSREFIFRGILMHLKEFSLNEINDYYEKIFQSYSVSEKDKALIKYVTLTTIRYRGFIEKTINLYLKKPLNKKMLEAKSGIMVGITQILFSRIPIYASVNTTVDLFRGNKKKWRPLVNALLRKVSRDKEKLIKKSLNKSINIPNWLIKTWQKQYGNQKTTKIIDSIFVEPAIDIFVKKNLVAAKENFDADLILNDTIRTKKPGNLKEISGYKEGEWWIQNIAAQLPVKILGNIKNKKIIELCAAPGGKTAQMLHEGAFVTSIEISKKRTHLLKKNIERLKLASNHRIVCADARKWKPNKKSEMTIVDVPCSSTGTLRKNPDVMWQKSIKTITEMNKLQKELLNTAINLTITNGTIIYCNCSLQFEEGEEIINYFLIKRKVKLVKINIKEIKGYPANIINKGLIRTLPYMYNDFTGMDGFFIARLKKI